MPRVEVDILTGHHNYAVLRLPGRRSPGVLFQGESLSSLTGDVDEALRLLRSGDHAAAEAQLEALPAHLGSLRAAYVGVLDGAGLPLPFERPA